MGLAHFLNGMGVLHFLGALVGVVWAVLDGGGFDVRVVLDLFECQDRVQILRRHNLLTSSGNVVVPGVDMFVVLYMDLSDIDSFRYGF